MLVCFPALLALAAQVFAGQGAGKETSAAAAENRLQEAS